MNIRCLLEMSHILTRFNSLKSKLSQSERTKVVHLIDKYESAKDKFADREDLNDIEDDINFILDKAEME